MASLRFSFGALSFLGLGLATACSSSSSGASPDAGSHPSNDASTTLSPLSDSGGGSALGIMATCGLLSAVGGGGSSTQCPSGQTCCTMLALPPTASCVPAGGCAGGLSNECMAGTDCMSGQVCCAGSADGGGGPALAIDAAAPAGGLGGGFGNFDTSALATTCQSSCTATQTQYCSTDSECPAGQTCQAPGAGGLGGAFGGLIMSSNICAAPKTDAGTTTVVEAGAGSDDGGGEVPDSGGADALAE
jgi:Cys-rich repeat protein